jgi:hypothetical protein
VTCDVWRALHQATVAWTNGWASWAFKHRGGGGGEGGGEGGGGGADGGGGGSMIDAAPHPAPPPCPPLPLVLALGCVLGASACSVDTNSASVSIAAAAAAAAAADDAAAAAADDDAAPPAGSCAHYIDGSSVSRALNPGSSSSSSSSPSLSHAISDGDWDWGVRLPACSCCSPVFHLPPLLLLPCKRIVAKSFFHQVLTIADFLKRKDDDIR